MPRGSRASFPRCTLCAPAYIRTTGALHAGRAMLCISEKLGTATKAPASHMLLYPKANRSSRSPGNLRPILEMPVTPNLQFRGK